MTRQILAVAFLCQLVVFSADFYVSPQGSDSWSGRLAAPNAAETDGPFPSIQRARKAVNDLRRSEDWIPRSITVSLRGGTYRLSTPLRFTPEDSGNPECPVIYEAYGDEKPVISGGRPIANWQKIGENLWETEVSWASTMDQPFTQLFVDGMRRTRARTPNKGSYLYSKRLTLGATGISCSGLTFHKRDLIPWPGLEDHGRIVLFHNWVNSYNMTGDINWARRRIHCPRPAGAYFMGPSVRYYVENVRACLDAPGEWYLDHKQGKLYYMPIDGKDPNTSEVIAPVISRTLLFMQGDPALGLYVDSLIFRGISFQHTDADLSPTYRHSVQGVHYQRGAIVAEALRNARFEKCEFAHLGEHAISLLEACTDNAITHCSIHDMGGGGVYLSEGAPQPPDPARFTLRNTVDNNLIYDGGHIFRAGCGVFLGGSASYTKVTHNEICDLSWMGVHLGWSWTGLRPAYTHHNEIAYNHIHHIGNGVLNDIGGIYTLGVSPGTVLHHNLIHDVTRFERGKQGYGGWGIYLDAGSSEIRVENNIVYDTRDGGLHLHNHSQPYGDVIINNIFAFSQDGDLMRNGNHDPETNEAHLESNIVYSSNPKILSGSNWKADSKFTSDRNCFWSEAGEPDFYGKSFTDWQATGRDTHSIIADPGFVNPEKRDFRLKPNSPALTIGFKPIDMSTVGLYGDKEWMEAPYAIAHRSFETAPPPENRWPIVDDFEEYNVGESPAQRSAAKGGTSLTIQQRSDRPEGQCMRFIDADGGEPWMPHWFVDFEPEQNPIDMHCSIRNDASEPASFDLEFRDWPKGETFRTGALLRFMPEGIVKVTVPGDETWKTLGNYPLGQWLEVHVCLQSGSDSPLTYDVSIEATGMVPVRVTALPCPHTDYKTCSWIGFAGMDKKKAVFEVDNIHIEPSKPSGHP